MKDERKIPGAAGGTLPSSLNPHPSSFVFDLVVVPDFRPEPRATFTVRTLFLLASWQEFAGGARRTCPLRLVCIGEPPASVARLAEQANAIVSVHPPLEIGKRRAANKLRAFETPCRTGRRLVIDADALILGDPARALAGWPGDALGAAPATVARVPAALWSEIYGAVGGEVPAERMLPVAGRLSLRAEAGAEAFSIDPMPPYFNSGVLLVPAGCPLPERWVAHGETIAAHFAEQEATLPAEARRAVVQSDQAALATALASLRREGWNFRLLPDGCHARRAHFRGGALRLADMSILHAISLFKGLPDLTLGAVEAALETWLTRWQSAIREGATARWRGPCPSWRAARDCRRAAGIVRGLWEQHVRPALLKG